jgi:hypothetical protein
MSTVFLLLSQDAQETVPLWLVITDKSVLIPVSLLEIMRTLVKELPQTVLKEDAKIKFVLQQTLSMGLYPVLVKLNILLIVLLWLINVQIPFVTLVILLQLQPILWLIVVPPLTLVQDVLPTINVLLLDVISIQDVPSLLTLFQQTITALLTLATQLRELLPLRPLKNVLLLLILKTNVS